MFINNNNIKLILDRYKLITQITMKKNPQSNKQVGDYILKKTLGEGTFSKVKLGTHKLTKQNVAIKILEKNKINDVADTQRVLREIHILKLMRHPNIVQLYDLVQTPKNLLLVMEFMENGELFQYIVQNTRIKQKQACKLFHQLINAIEHIHKLGIVHRDLKPQNLLLDHRKNLKLVDFGLSNTYRKNQKLKTPCGSQCYAAPEMLRGQQYQGLKVDIWSAGVILFAMLCGYLPFQESDNFNLLYEKICSSDYKMHDSVSQTARDLISKILNVDTQKRYTIQDIRNHHWMKAHCESSDTRDIQKGIVIGYNNIPIDKNILGMLSQYGFSDTQIQKTSSSLQANRHNSLTTTYYLRLKKYIRDGGVSLCDLGSDNFDPQILSPNFSKKKDQEILKQRNGVSVASKRSGRDTGKISVLLDNYLTKQKNQTQTKSKEKHRIKQKSKQKDRRKSKDKFLHEKSLHKDHNNSLLKNKLQTKENNNPNISSQDQQRPRRQRLNSRPSKVDPAIENSINYGRGSIPVNSTHHIHTKSIQKHHPSQSRQKSRESHFQNRLSRKYKQKFNQSLVSRSRDHHRPPLNSKTNVMCTSSQMIGSHNNSHLHINSNRMHGVVNSKQDKTNNQQPQNEQMKEVFQKEVKRNRRVLSHKTKKSNGGINSIKSDLNRIPKARWI